MPPFTIPFSSIIEGDRARKDYGDLSGLKDSLTRMGSIHPIVLSKTDLGYVLIAGGRRYRAMKELGVIELVHGSVLEPTALGFSFKDDVPEHELREAELDENLYRLKPKWQEDVCLIRDVHDLKRRLFGTNKWGVAQTAALLGDGYGKTNVNYAVRLAKLIKSNDKDIIACENMSDAIALMVKRKEDEALAVLHKRAAASTTAFKTPVVGMVIGVGAGSSLGSTASFLDSFSISTVPGKVGTNEVPTSASISATLQETPLTSAPPVEIPLSRMFFLGESVHASGAPRLLAAIPDASFDHIVTDIPYGIDMDALNATTVVDVKDEHDVDQNLAMMPHFLRESFRLVRPGGFCVFWYDLDHHEKLQTWAREAGWKVQSWPLTWIKSHVCQNNAAQYNFTKNTEVAMVLRRDSQTVLRKHCGSSWLMCDGAAERKMYNNPFAKPFELWKWIYDAIAFPGQSVLDPYCGEMSACRAAVNCGLVPYGIECSDQHFNRGIEHMKAVYALLHKSNVLFT